MTLTIDLRNAWFATIPSAGNTAGEGGEAGPDSPPADPPSPADSDDAGEPTEDELRNPRLKRLHDEAAKYRTSAKAEKERADKAEAALRSLALRTAFDRVAAKEQVVDVEAAWKLAADDVQALEMGEDGTVDTDALAGVLRDVAQRHPGVVADALPSGRATNGRRKPDELNMAVLEKKFPALKRSANRYGSGVG